MQASALPATGGASVGCFDDRGGMELDPAKDFRVIVAQDALGDRDDPCVLFDSLSSPDVGYNAAALRRDSASAAVDRARLTHSRTSSTASSRVSATATAASQLPREPDPRTNALFAMRARPPPPPPPFPPAVTADINLGRMTADSGLLNCIFGSNAFTYESSTNKMHVFPADSDSAVELDHGLHSTRPQRGVAAARPPPGVVRSTSSSLGRDYAGPNASSFSSSSLPSPSPSSSSSNRVTVMFTRMFSVQLPDERRPLDAAADGGPFPDLQARMPYRGKKTPMYAVSITIKLPPNRGQLWNQGPESLKSPNTMASSLDSDGWLNSSLFSENSRSSSLATSVDDRIDYLLEHGNPAIWRALCYLEKLASAEILRLLKKLDNFSSLQGLHRPPSICRSHIIQLPPYALASSNFLREEALRESKRISLAIRIPRVVNGQNKWGVWRDEARRIVKCPGDKELHFLLVLITGFLGNHTEWLRSFGPEWHKHHHRLKQRAQRESQPVIPNHTVVVSADKVTARRLIFVLSAFLPGRSRPDSSVSPRPGTSASFSQSPPPPVAPFRQKSLRRTINERSIARQVNGDAVDVQPSSLSSNEMPPIEEPVFSKSPECMYSTRRGSDSRSIRTTSLPMTSSDVGALKNGAATIATAPPEYTTPVPHFVSQSRRQSLRNANFAEDTNSSIASDNLAETLRRSERTAADMNDEHPRKWGGFLSSFWGSPPSQKQQHPPFPPRLDTSRASVDVGSMPGSRRRESAPRARNMRNPSVSTVPLSESPASPATPECFNVVTPSSPLKASVGEDSVVNVALPLPGFIDSSFKSDGSGSPQKAHMSLTSTEGAGSFLGSTGPLCAQNCDGDDISVAGWLKWYHEDFILQAVHPYDGLHEDIKRSMTADTSRQQPAPSTPDANASPDEGRWADVCTTLVADVSSYTVRRLRLRRWVVGGVWTARRGGPDEEFVEEVVADVEPTLTDTVDRVLAQAPTATNTALASRAQSRAPSPARRRHLDGAFATAMVTKASMSPLSSSPLTSVLADPVFAEVPREKCKSMVTGALGEVVSSVLTEQSGVDEDQEPYNGHGNDRAHDGVEFDSCAYVNGDDGAVSSGNTSSTLTPMSTGPGHMRGLDKGDRRSVGRSNGHERERNGGRCKLVDNILRQGIRGWLEDVEGSCW